MQGRASFSVPRLRGVLAVLVGIILVAPGRALADPPAPEEGPPVGERLSDDAERLVRGGGRFPDDPTRARAHDAPEDAGRSVGWRLLRRALELALEGTAEEVSSDPECRRLLEAAAAASGRAADEVGRSERLHALVWARRALRAAAAGRDGSGEEILDLVAAALDAWRVDPTAAISPPGPVLVPAEEEPAGEAPDARLLVLGAPARPVPGPEGPCLVLVGVPPGSLAAEAGLEAGDLILEVEGRRVGDGVDLEALAGGRREGQLTLRLLRRVGSTERWVLEFDDPREAPRGPLEPAEDGD